MAKINFSIPHPLSQEQALSVIKAAITKYKDEYANLFSDITEEWKDNVGTFSAVVKRNTISGTLTVMPSSVDIEADVPWALTLFKGKAEKLLQEHASKIFSKK